MTKKAIVMEILRNKKDIDRRGLIREISEETGVAYNYVQQLRARENARRKMKSMYFTNPEDEYTLKKRKKA